MAEEQGMDEGGEGREAPPPDYEAEARKSGWTPRETYKGDPAKWLDAKTWVERGEQFIPFLNSSNRRLKEELSTMQQQLEQERRLNRANSKALEELQEESSTQRTESLAGEKDKLMDAIVAAHESGDIRQELQLRDSLSEVNDRIRALKAKPAPAASAAVQPSNDDVINHPAMKRFMRDNPWFKEDYGLAGAAIGVLNGLNASGEGKDMTPEERLQYVEREMQRRFNVGSNERRSAPSKVESGGGGRGGSSETSGKSWDDMPADVRSQCDKLSKRFIGKVNGKGEVKYPDLATYRAHFAKDYFDEDWGNKALNS